MTFQEIAKNETIRAYIRKADESLISLGYTEHSFSHVTHVAGDVRYILETLEYDAHTVEIAQIAGYLHDIGNVVNRIDHAQSGAVMAFRILDKMGADAEDIATIVTAIGNHDEKTAFPVNPIAAALILADKCDVRDTRVRNTDHITFDIHDRVNYSVKQSKLLINVEKKEIELRLRIDTSICAVMDYFEIFLNRMILCKKAAEKLELKFILRINGQKLM